MIPILIILLVLIVICLIIIMVRQQQIKELEKQNQAIDVIIERIKQASSNSQGDKNLQEFFKLYGRRAN